MANFDNIIQEINTNIPDNTTQAITAAKMRTTLIDAVGDVNTKKQDTLTFDNTPTENSTNPVTSGGIYNALQGISDLFESGQEVSEVSIINNLTTGGTEDVLSAEQGKVLNDKIKELPSTNTIEESDLYVGDEEGNVLVEFKEGEVKTKNFNSIETPKSVQTGYNDLYVGDEEGNVLVEFKNGHIKTKNFDSTDFVNNKFAGKKIGIIGDSISTYNGWLPSDIEGYDGSTYAHYYPRGNVNNVSKTWWYKLAVMLGLNPSTDISNCAWSGSKVSGNSDSTTNAAAGCSNRRISDLTLRFNGVAPDIIICFISCNDWGKTPNIPIGTWAITDPIPSGGIISELRAAYALMLNKLHTTYPLAKVFCCTNLDDVMRDATAGWPTNNASGVSTYEWNRNIVEVAQALGCEIIDFNRCGINYSNIATYYAVDSGLHPNDAGHTLMAEKAYKELINKY